MIRVIYSLDENNGYLFNNRRQTYDQAVLEHILNNVVDTNTTLWLSDYSKDLFKEFDITTKRLEEIDLAYTKDNSVVFVENIDFDIETIAKKCIPLELIFYKWNKVYPADKKLNLTEFYLNNFEVIETKNLIGHTHESILFERWALKKR